jgi:hypothetical protein
MSSRSPVLFLVFNRPDTTRLVFEAIRAARPPRLYVAADGPRSDRPGDAERCGEVRRIATAVDWPCRLVTRFLDSNHGCRNAVSQAVTWFFDQEPEGIVLEDDCLPEPSFFGFCEELLERYRDDHRVMSISGDNFISSVWQPTESYYLSRYVHIWGWASWRRAWQHYDVSMASWNTFDHDDLLRLRFPGAPRAQRYWRRVLDRVSAGQIDTWDYQWVYAAWRQAGLSCMPRNNLVSNIGFGLDATFTKDTEGMHANLSREAIQLPLTHPRHVVGNVAADRWTTRHVFSVRERWFAAERWREWCARTTLRREASANRLLA